MNPLLSGFPPRKKRHDPRRTPSDYQGWDTRIDTEIKPHSNKLSTREEGIKKLSNLESFLYLDYFVSGVFGACWRHVTLMRSTFLSPA